MWKGEIERNFKKEGSHSFTQLLLYDIYTGKNSRILIWVRKKVRNRYFDGRVDRYSLKQSKEILATVVMWKSLSWQNLTLKYEWPSQFFLSNIVELFDYTMNTDFSIRKLLLWHTRQNEVTFTPWEKRLSLCKFRKQEEELFKKCTLRTCTSDFHFFDILSSIYSYIPITHTRERGGRKRRNF